MGVPAFCRWLAEKYPVVVVDVVEEEAVVIEGIKIPVDTKISGPLRVESDNNCENVGVFGALELDVSAFAAKLTDESEFESRLAEPSFSLGTSVGLQKKPMRNPVTVDTLDEFSSPDVLEDRIYVIPCMYHIPRSCGAPSELKSYAQS